MYWDCKINFKKSKGKIKTFQKNKTESFQILDFHLMNSKGYTLWMRRMTCKGIFDM